MNFRLEDVAEHIDPATDFGNIVQMPRVNDRRCRADADNRAGQAGLAKPFGGANSAGTFLFRDVLNGFDAAALIRIAGMGEDAAQGSDPGPI